MKVIELFKNAAALLGGINEPNLDEVMSEPRTSGIAQTFRL